VRQQQHVWAAKVRTTNSSNDMFKVDVGGSETYLVCEDSIVYLVAPDIEDAARQLPSAVRIEYVGTAFEDHRSDRNN
jgi:hypothetical protein